MRAHEKSEIRTICAKEIHFHEEWVKAQKSLVEANKELIMQQFFERQVDTCEALLRAVTGLSNAVLRVVNREASEGDK